MSEQEHKWKPVVRTMLQLLLILLGILGVILGSLEFANVIDMAPAGQNHLPMWLIIIGIVTVIVTTYFMVVSVPRVTQAGENPRTARESAIDTIVPFCITGVGAIVGLIATCAMV